MSAFGLDIHDEICESLTASGIATWNIEFRRIGDAGGGYPGTFIDIGRAIDFLLDIAPMHDLDLKRVVTLGHSAGGHLALWAAARRKLPAMHPLVGEKETQVAVRAAVSLAGVSDLRLGWLKKMGGNVIAALVGATPAESPERYEFASPAELLPLGVPQVLIHGRKDDLVPFEMSQSYCAAALASGDSAKLVALDGTGHFELIDARSREWMQIVREVMELMEEQTR